MGIDPFARVTFRRAADHRCAPGASRRRSRSSGLLALIAVAALLAPPAAFAASPAPSGATSTTSGSGAVATAPKAHSVTPLPIDTSATGGGFAPDVTAAAWSKPPAVVRPSVQTEVPSARAWNSRVYANPNGTFTKQVSEDRMNYQDADGAWQPINTALESQTSPAYGLRETANDLSLQVSKADPDAALVSLAGGAYALDVRVPGLTASATSTSATGVGFAAGPGASVTVTPTVKGFEFGATIVSPSAPTSYSFAVATHGLGAVLGADNATVLLKDPALAQGTSATVGIISAPALVDATGEPAPPGTVSVSLDAAAAGLRPGEVLLTYAITPTWLATPGLAYPVVLDPTACIQYTTTSNCTINGGNAGYVDTFVQSANPYTPGTGTLDYIGVDPSLGTTRSLYFFPHVIFPDGAQIVSAFFELHQHTGASGGQVVSVLPVTSGWDGNATWSNRPSADSGGGVTVNAISTPGTIAADVTTMVRARYTRNALDWKSDYGFMALLNNETNPCPGSTSSCYRLVTEAGSYGSNEPILSITYWTPQVSFAFDSSTLGSDFAPSTMAVSGSTSLPVIVTNNGSGFTFNHSGTDSYKVGYRWFNANGTYVSQSGFTASGSADLGADLASGASSGTINLTVTAPPAPGQYSLRLDLLHLTTDGNIWSSDWAQPSAYYTRTFLNPADPSNTRMVGSSVVQRADFPIAVVAGQGSSVGTTKSVDLPDGSTVGINLWSSAFDYTGSGGVSFPDIAGSVGLTYGYNSVDRGFCSGILGACGWSTNYDEGFYPGTNGADYTYRDAAGNVSAVSANGDNQLVSSAPVQIDRFRTTILDENTIFGWNNTAPSIVTGAAPSGSHYYTIPSNQGYTSSTASTASGFPTVRLAAYPSIHFSVETATTGAAIGFKIHDNTTGAENWFFYTVGPTDFPTTGYPHKYLPGTLSGSSWSAFTSYLLDDVIANGSYGAASDDYAVNGISLVGNGTATTTAYDSVYYLPRSSGLFTGSMPAWTANGSSATLDSNPPDEYLSYPSVQVAATSASPTYTLGTPSPISNFGYIGFAWRKLGGGTIGETFGFKDGRTGGTGSLTYYAGPTPPPGAPNPIQVSPTAPANWTFVVRDFQTDARQVFGFYNDADFSGTSSRPNAGPLPDVVKLTGYTVLVPDGAYGLFNAEGEQSLPLMGMTDTRLNEDFVVTLAGGLRHVFDRDGRLVRIVDANGNTTKLAWPYNYTAGVSSLASVAAPSESAGMTLSDGSAAAVRHLSVTAATSGCGLAVASCVRVTENLGSGSDTGRYTEFEVTGTKDLSGVVPARWSAACAAAPAAQQCLTYDYSDSSNHYLWHIYDPRSGTGAPDSTTLGYSHVAAQSVYEAAPGAYLLEDLSATVGAPGGGLRVAWQDANSVVSNYVRFSDLSPNGSALTEWRPVPCSGTNCSSSAPSDRLASYLSDGIDQLTSETRFRLPGNAGAVTSRRATFAAARVNSYVDPLTASLVAWTQSPEQYAASIASGDIDRYRTSYAYDAQQHKTDVTSPLTDPVPDAAPTIVATPNLAGYWRLNETSGTSAADSSGAGHPGTYAGGYTLGQAGALVGDPTNKAVTFNGSSGSASASPGTITGSYTVEAWVKPAGFAANETFVGTRGPGDLSFDAKIMAGGTRLHGDIGTGSAWLTITADATYTFSAGTWYHIVYVVSPTGYLIVINGLEAAAGTFSSGTPLLTDGAHTLYLGQNGVSTTPEWWNGSLDEVAIYSRALAPNEIAAHFAAAGAATGQDLQTIYDPTGNPIQTIDNALADPGFENGLAGWTTSGGAALYTTTSSSDPAVHTGTGSLRITGTGTASETVQLVPGQAYRAQVWARTDGTSHATVTVSYWSTSAGAWVARVGPTGLSETSWTANAWEDAVPLDGDGRVRLIVANDAGAGIVAYDDTALLTTLTQTTYGPTGLVLTTTDSEWHTTNLEYGPSAGYQPNLLTNGGFASGTTGWTVSNWGGSGVTGLAIWSNNATWTLHDGDTTSYNVATGNYGSTANIHFATNAGGAAISSTPVAATPGQAYSVSAIVANHRLTAAYLAISFNNSGGTQVGSCSHPSTSKSGGADRSGWDYETSTCVAPPTAATVYVQEIGQTPFTTGSDAYLWLDEVRLVAGSSPLPYLAAPVTPAIFPTRITKNYKSGQGASSDQNVPTIATYDRWGRAIATIDPDGIAAFTSMAPNATDLASSSDGLGDTKQHTAVDPVGNVLTSVDELGRTSTATYDFANHVIESTAADGSRSHTDYDAAGRVVDTIAGCAASYAGAIACTPNLAGYWRLNEPSGTSAADSSGAGHPGTYAGGSTLGASGAFPSEPTNTAVTFNGSSGSASASPGTITGSYTVEAWVKPAGFAANETFVGTRGPGDLSFDAKIMAGGTRLHGDIGTGSAWLTITADATYTFAAGTWYHIVYVVSPTGYTIYINGAAVASGSYSGTPVLTDASHALYLAQNGIPSTPEWWNGTLDEVAIYSRALSAAEVATHDAAGFASGPTTPLETTNAYATGSGPGGELGLVTRSLADAWSGGVGATTDYTYDLFGQTTSSTVYPSGTSGGRTTRSYFDAAGNTSGSADPIAPAAAPAPLCPGTGSTYCDAVKTLDMNGLATSSTDRYGVVTQLWSDFAGRPVKVVVNPTTGSGNDQNVTTTNQYNALGWLISTTDPLGRVTNTTFDNLGRATMVERPDTSFVRTDYTAAGRTLEVSRPATAGTPDASLTWTRTLYDLAGRAVETIADYDHAAVAHTVDTSFEAGDPGWSGGSSGWFLASSAGLAITNVPAQVKTGAAALAVTVSARYGGAEWFLPGTFATHAYHVHADVWVPSGHTITTYFGEDVVSSPDYTNRTLSGTGTWQTIDFTAAALTGTTNVRLAVRTDDAAPSFTYDLDNVEIWDTDASNSPPQNVATETGYDAAGHVTASTLAPGHLGEAIPVTTTTYDALGRVTSVTVNTVPAATGSYPSLVRSTRGLLADFPLTDPAGTMAAELTGTYPATLQGGVTLGDGGPLANGPSAAMKFNGTSGSAAFSGVDLTRGDFTLEGWIKPTTLATGWNQFFGAKVGGFALGLVPNGGSDALELTISSIQDASAPATTSIPLNVWTHVAASYVAASKTVTYYVNGAAAGSGTFTSPPTPAALTNMIGNNGGGYSGYFPGSLSELAIYGRALTGAEIAAHDGAGAGTATADANLTTAYAYDPLWRRTDRLDPIGIDTATSYDRLGRTTATTLDALPGDAASATVNVRATFAYDALGELTAQCTPAQVQANGCDPTSTTTGSVAYQSGSHLTYDADGHQLTSTPPVNVGTGATALFEHATVYDAVAGRVASVCDMAAGSASCAGSETRHTDPTYDALGRVLSSTLYAGLGTGTTKLISTYAYDLDGERTSVAFNGTGSGEGTDTLTYQYDPLGQVLEIDRSGTATSKATYFPDGTLATRTDPAVSTTTAASFTYDAQGRLTTASSPLYTGLVTFTWRPDGLLDTETLPGTSISLAYTYDGAKRPLGSSSGTLVAFSRTYDRVGDVTSETQTLSGIAGEPGGGTESFTYDALRRVLSSAVPGPSNFSEQYAYDADSNRLSVATLAGTTSYTYDRTDELLTKTIPGPVTTSFAYDAYGNMTTSQVAANATAYVYDLADRLTTLNPPSGGAIGFTFDALGRHLSQAIGGVTSHTYAYLGSTDTVVQDVAGSTTLNAAVDASGDRLASSSGSGFGWTLPDLHGDVAGMLAANGASVTDAFRYSAYGALIGSVKSALPTPWRYQGKLLESSSGNTDLYDFVARSYDPALGVFTQLDTVAGSAQNPLSLNRFLYGEADPETLVDPDGHCARNNPDCTAAQKKEYVAQDNAREWAQIWRDRRLEQLRLAAKKRAQEARLEQDYGRQRHHPEPYLSHFVVGTTPSVVATALSGGGYDYQTHFVTQTSLTLTSYSYQELTVDLKVSGSTDPVGDADLADLTLASNGDASLTMPTGIANLELHGHSLAVTNLAGPVWYQGRFVRAGTGWGVNTKQLGTAQPEVGPLGAGTRVDFHASDEWATEQTAFDLTSTLTLHQGSHPPILSYAPSDASQPVSVPGPIPNLEAGGIPADPELQPDVVQAPTLNWGNLVL